MSTPFDAVPPPGLVPALHVGQPVHVNAGAAWLSATVTSITHSRIGLAYSPDVAARFTGAVSPWVVRPADGARLIPVHEVRAGDDVVAFTGTVNTIKTLHQCGDGWWAIDYRSGARITVPPTAVLRLRDSAPSRHHRGRRTPEVGSGRVADTTQRRSRRRGSAAPEGQPCA